MEDDERGRKGGWDESVTSAGGEKVLEEGDREISGIGEDTGLVEKEERHKHGECGEHLGKRREEERRRGNGVKKRGGIGRRIK